MKIKKALASSKYLDLGFTKNLQYFQKIKDNISDTLKIVTSRNAKDTKMDIAQTMELFLPLASAWVEQQEEYILKYGVALTEAQKADAVRVGVRNADKVRVLVVDEIPWPRDPILYAKGVETGLVSPYTAGMAMRYGVFLCKDIRDHRETLVHELTHTAQYERLGSISAFLKQYLTECLTVGYSQSPLEREAVTSAKMII